MGRADNVPARPLSPSSSHELAQNTGRRPRPHGDMIMYIMLYTASVVCICIYIKGIYGILNGLGSIQTSSIPSITGYNNNIIYTQTTAYQSIDYELAAAAARGRI